MIAQNEVKVHEELANKNDDRTVSYKHCAGRTLVHIKQWCLCNCSIPDGRGETQLTSLCN